MSARTQRVPVSSAPLQDDLMRQVERVVRSEAFSGSEILRKLLEYLAVRTLDNPGSCVKAKEIAAAVFGRTSDFDPQNDSIVRVHAGRLRSKLAEYYVAEGSEDDAIVSIPKWSYDLSVRYRSGSVANPAANSAAPEHPELTWAPGGLRRMRARWYTLGLVLALALGWTGAKVATPRPVPSRLTPGLATFWQSFLANEDRAMIVYSNLKVRSFETDRILLLPSNGEVLGVFQITKFFTSIGKAVRPKHGVTIGWDEAKDVDLIFLGGPLAETPLRDIPTFYDFVFRTGAPAEGAPSIENLHPRNGEARIYTGSPRPQQFDYAIVALTTSFSPKHRVLTLAGISGYGTQGAAEFVTREDRIQALLSRMAVKNRAPMPSFEAVIRFNVQGETALQPEIVALHRSN
jgi:hypothetical protein